MISSIRKRSVVPFPRERCQFGMRGEAQYFLEEFTKTPLDWVNKEAPWIELAPVSTEDFLLMTGDFLMKQEEFQKRGKPVGVQIAYHYTSPKGMKDIQHDGLRTSAAVRGFYGKGIYVGNNPHAFRYYGDVGVIVLILTGVQKKMYDKHEDALTSNAVDSYLGNKLHDESDIPDGTRYFDETILRNSAQVLPLLRYSRELANNADLLWRFHLCLQEWVDQMFPHGWPSSPQRIFPNYNDIQFEFRLAKSQSFFTRHSFRANVFAPAYAASTTSLALSQFRQLFGMALHMPRRTLFLNLGCNTSSLIPGCPKEKEDCPICLMSLGSQKSIVINKCQHAFHKVCLDRAVMASKRCPLCRMDGYW